MKFGMVYQLKRNNILIDSRASAVLIRFLIKMKPAKAFVLPVNICPIVKSLFNYLEIPIFFCDISETNFCIDESNLIRILNSNDCSGVLLNHSYGYNPDFEHLINFLKDKYNNLIIIEDKCLSIPDTVFNSQVDLTLYSTGYSKYVQLNYNGGYGILNDHLSINNENETKYQIILENSHIINVNNFSKDRTEYFEDIHKYKLNIVSHKNTINDLYNRYLSDFSIGQGFHNWRYNIFIKKKELVLKKIFEAGYFASSHYKPLDSDSLKFRNSLFLHSGLINLFNDYNYTEDQAIETAKIILKYS